VTYYTRLPDDVTIFDIEEFLDRIDSQFSSEVHTKMKEESWVSTLDSQKVDHCGRQAFGSSWSEVKDYLIISEDNLDAHPFLFELKVTEERRFPGSRRPREIQTTKVFYPRFYAQIMKFQVFPLLRNGKEPSSHQLLADITGDRGTVYERNLYDFITDQGIECYHGAEITKANPNEIDLLCVFEDSLKFIEVKYLMPPIRINDKTGVRELNEDFDRLIFNEVVEDSDRKAKGKPYPEKVNVWMELEAGESFTSQVGADKEDRQEQVFKEEWKQLLVYWLLKIALGIAVGIITVVLFIATLLAFALAGLVMALPVALLYNVIEVVGIVVGAFLGLALLMAFAAVMVSLTAPLKTFMRYYGLRVYEKMFDTAVVTSLDG